MSSTLPVLNFCNKNLAACGSEAYRKYKTDPRVLVDEPPSCMTRCYECQFAPIAVYAPFLTDDVEEDQWEYLIAGTIETPGTQQDLIDIIETLLSKRT